MWHSLKLQINLWSEAKQHAPHRGISVRLSCSLLYLIFGGLPMWQNIHLLFSLLHHSYSWIDYFFGNVPALWLMATADISPITWSDHAPVILTLTNGHVSSCICHCRLNESLLKKPQFREELRQHITEYFAANEGSVSSSAILWEAHKTVIFGHCISRGTWIKKNLALQTENTIASILLKINSYKYSKLSLNW